jgi:O-antigen/teichoic acid export membrane protein
MKFTQDIYLVYFIPKFSLKKIYTSGLLWTIICTVLCVAVMLFLFVFFEVGSIDHWVHLVALSLLIIIHSFHMVIILAKERIKIYNFLNFFQPALLLSVLFVMFFVFHIKTIDSYIIALYVSFSAAIILSIIQVASIFKNHNNTLTLFEPKRIIENGFYNQLANLCHMLSNRYNFYLLGNTVLVGIYSSATSLIESVWIISGSVSPIILTYIANEKDPANNAKIHIVIS